ncbi:CDP-diacylglycerol--glycerol-3-phosphate 3-phosphatidyltransferase [Oceanimonas baumannii]|uniref:CDP-diacylglycerol--glycerol-3-phosphate 3-phosphatidyltransferase n=1 Tax=Oceanimonas baumannii TaxID=129578 RepID=A0A235CK40_9GAMM|nr:CDP-diacylglycerol--glycerol-3-phosphate 3-phosphatidyltransferase [Oceanimonas baumannii]MCC4262976.1 CDP-diacylglycerol--glycerol-3-phosphate 3-phosphatidyltransferase [Oceanimonas baumannii]OYD24892.1 CDP-diacylglycerol--glycerol-3-phosphate 3-phosphatidyltransferase [Oceanimonas baumannii]TDW59652.1 CDP-diacylglycerol--glycerol-3-phosphate 3-phosphatidyltransferase [Oceanimonas baumannii]
MINVPNSLTFFRILLIPVFIVLFYLPVEWGYFWAAAVFAFAAATDWLDGFLARRLEQSTPFGAFLDPVADKVMVAAALVLIVDDYSSALVTIPAMFMIGREIMISALREWMAEIGQRSRVAVSWIGKWKTTIQMLALIGLIWQQSIYMVWISYVLLYVATGLTLFSAYDYLRAAWGDLTRSE